MAKIKNILYDLGGVIVDLDAQHNIEAFKRLGMPEIAELINPYHPAGMIGELEHGDITFHEMCDKMRQVTGREEVTDQQISDAYNAFLMGIEDWKLPSILEMRRRGFKTYVLSNNNPMSMQSIREMFRRDGLEMEDYFDGIYLSYELHLLKPHKEIYEKIIELSGIRPEETLFIDDSDTNVNVARELGFAVYMPAVGEDFRPIFENLELEAE